MSRLIALLRRIVARFFGAGMNVSAGYKLNPDNLESLTGWTDAGVAERQHAAFTPLIEQALQGNPRLDFQVAADAIAAAGERNPLVLEVGCGSGYYSAVLPALLGASIRYVGLDYSSAMTALAKMTFPESCFVAGDALALPMATASCDVCLSGTSLMHIPEYPRAIAEMARVSRRWCVFHTVPVMANRSTTVMSKLAYGAPVPEIVFNQTDIERLFLANGLQVRNVRESFPYDLSSVIGEPTITLTYLCEKVA